MYRPVFQMPSKYTVDYCVKQHTYLFTVLEIVYLYSSHSLPYYKQLC